MVKSTWLFPYVALRIPETKINRDKLLIYLPFSLVTAYNSLVEMTNPSFMMNK